MVAMIDMAVVLMDMVTMNMVRTMSTMSTWNVASPWAIWNTILTMMTLSWNLIFCWGGARTQLWCIYVPYFVKDKGITFFSKWHTAGLLYRYQLYFWETSSKKPEDSMSDVGLALISSGTTIFLAMISAIFAMRSLISELTHGDGMRLGMLAGSWETYPPTHLLPKITNNRSKGTKYRWLITIVP